VACATEGGDVHRAEQLRTDVTVERSIPIPSPVRGRDTTHHEELTRHRGGVKMTPEQQSESSRFL